MEREEVYSRFVWATVVARELARRFWAQTLPEPLCFVVLLNCSYDGHLLHPDERVFPDEDSLSNRLALRRCTLDETVEPLWRDGLIPEWIDIAALRPLRDTTVSRCSRAVWS